MRQGFLVSTSLGPPFCEPEHYRPQFQRPHTLLSAHLFWCLKPLLTSSRRGLQIWVSLNSLALGEVEGAEIAPRAATHRLSVPEGLLLGSIALYLTD